MESWVRGLELAGEALLSLALNPFYYIGLLLVILLFRRQTLLERKLFYVRSHRMLGEFLLSLGWSWLAGLVVSAATAGFGLLLTMEAVWWIWGITVVLLAVRIRYACIAYAAAIIGLLQTIGKLFPQVAEAKGIEDFVASLLNIHLPSLFALAALLHLAEAILIRLQGVRTATPLYVGGKRGKVVGAYEWQSYWTLPLFIVVPAAAGDGMAGMPWPMFFGDMQWNAGWSLLAFPALIGFTGTTATELPKRKTAQLAKASLLFALLLGLLAVGAEWLSYVAIGAAGVSFVLHELLIRYDSRREQNRSPVFVHGPRGLKVLDVQPGSPAADMGIVRGETVVKANGMPVGAKDELHAALRLNSAFCKLEVIDLNGQNRFTQRALYDGEHHQLGLVLCPDDSVIHYVEWKPLTIASLIGIKRKGRVPSGWEAQTQVQEEGSESVI